MRFILIHIVLFIIFASNSCVAQQSILPGAYQIEEYLPDLKNKNVAVVANHTSLINQTHLVDSLLARELKLVKIFTPEHGFRGKADAGELVDNEQDAKTGLPVISLYGSNKKPKPEDLKSVDIVIFDLQDVGVRFYTYISSLFYVMEACAENNIPLIVLDRPNPNADYIAGPVIDDELKSFVGIIPIPIVYGLTIGELSRMINGEGWLKNGIKCNLKVIQIKNWNHQSKYELPVKPSPNLPNYQSVRLYPSLCIFEGSNMSIGRGTEFPFQVIGYPDQNLGDFAFTPRAIKGMSMNPKHKNKTCYGLDLRNEPAPIFTLKWFFEFYEKSADKKAFLERPEWIEMLIGDTEFIEKVEQGWTETEILNSWKEELTKFAEKRKIYLLYK